MGYQLWTSPVTGYRRKGTRLSDLRSVLGAGNLARTILEPLQCCPSDALADEMKKILQKRGFDVAGVQVSPKGPVTGFVVKDTLTGGTINDHTSPIRAEHLISEATPLDDLFRALHTKERVFVLMGTEPKGIVTRADLNKPPVRVYLFGLVSLLEMHLTFWVRRSYSDNSWEQTLKEERLEVARKLQAARRVRNEDITLLDCLQFCDKRELLLAKIDVRSRLGVSSKRQFNDLLKHAEELRNRLAHSQDDLVQGSSWQELIDVIEKIEDLVHQSDAAVEEEAKAASKSVDELWVAG